MLGATLSFLGLYEYDNTLFDGLTFPAGVDHDTLIENFLYETAELEVIYPDPDFMKMALTIYGRRQAAVWASLAETFDLEYNPIWNVDGSIKETEKRDRQNTDNLTHAESGKSTSSGTETTDRAGFNSSAYGADERIRTSGDGSASLNRTEDRTGAENENVVRETRRTGNIGVTTTQQMLREELEIRPSLNIYDYIIKDLTSRFCLLVY